MAIWRKESEKNCEENPLDQQLNPSSLKQKRFKAKIAEYINNSRKNEAEELANLQWSLDQIWEFCCKDRESQVPPQLVHTIWKHIIIP